MSKKKSKKTKSVKTPKHMLRVAVSGSTRDELADNLIALAEDFRKGEMVSRLADDNCAGDLDKADGTSFGFDYCVFKYPKDEIVSVYPGEGDE